MKNRHLALTSQITVFVTTMKYKMFTFINYHFAKPSYFDIGSFRLYSNYMQEETHRNF